MGPLSRKTIGRGRKRGFFRLEGSLWWKETDPSDKICKNPPSQEVGTIICVLQTRKLSGSRPIIVSVWVWGQTRTGLGTC